MKSIKLLLIVVWLAVCVIAPFQWGHRLNTRIIPNVRKNIAKVYVGTTLAEVYSTLGNPMFVVLSAGATDGAFVSTTLLYKDLTRVERVSSDANGRLSLIYSDRRISEWEYELFYVNVEAGRVIELGAGVLQD